MKILVHDYSGHPYSVQLSRALAKRNHQVLYIYSGSFQSPHGNLNKLATELRKYQLSPYISFQAFCQIFFPEKKVSRS